MRFQVYTCPSLYCGKLVSNLIVIRALCIVILLQLSSVAAVAVGVNILVCSYVNVFIIFEVISRTTKK